MSPQRPFLILASLFLLAGGCSAERRHAVLSFLFDGVPAPGAPPAGSRVSAQFIRDDGKAVVSRLNMKFHRPYQDNQCTKCHPQGSSLAVEAGPRRGLCWTCHEHDAFKARIEGLPRVHGPVAVEDCGTCHDPHESIHAKLLTDPDPRLCYSCHDRESTLSAPPHGALEKELCLPCHEPHGGESRYFLKPGTTPAGPSKDRGP